MANAETVTRYRKKLSYTLSDDTVAFLHKLVDDGEAKNYSRAIERLAQFYQAHSERLIVGPLDPEEQRAFTQFCILKGGGLPGDVLAEMCREKIIEI